MVEILLRRFPVKEVEIFAVVLEVTAYTIFAIGILHLQTEVVAVLVGERVGNFFVAIETFERGSACTKNVAGVALSGAGKRRMRFAEWAGGNLRVRASREEQSNAGEQQREGHCSGARERDYP